MKRFLFLTLILSLLPLVSNAEAIKLKNGTIINGSILDRGEYILRVQTSYGPISINQGEVEAIMPDLHRVLLKGGGEFVGTVVDLDEFNLTLNTDSGIVNLDVAEISSMEVYDYESAEKQKKYITKKQELEQAAQEEAKAAQESGAAASGAAASAGAVSSSGLSFDEDLEKVFPSKPEVIEPKITYKYHVHSTQQQAEEQEEEEEKPVLTEEEKKQQEQEDALITEQIKKKDTGKNYFGVNLGMMSGSLSLDLSEYGGSTEEKMSGANVAFSLAYMRKMTNRLWFGGSIGYAMLPSGEFEFPLSGQDKMYVETSGQVYDINLLSNFYLNTQSALRFYLTGGLGYTSASVEESPSKYELLNSETGEYGWTTQETNTISSGNINAMFGLGAEYAIDDVNLGFEVKGKYFGFKDELENSSKLSVYAMLKINWFF